MRKTQTFRPTGGEVLEDRTVPSGGLDGIFGGLIGSVPAQDARQVAQAFATFERTYSQDVRTILLPSGTTDFTASRQAFDKAIGSALADLNTSIDTTIKNLPTAATLQSTVQDELLGSGPNSLSTQLAAIPTPSDLTYRSASSFSREGLRDIYQTAGQVTDQVRIAPAPTGTITAQAVRQTLQSVENAFRTFNQTYNQAVQSTLLPKGTTDPSTNRAAFNAAVTTALNTLNTSVASAVSTNLSALPPTLATTIQNDLLTTTASPGTTSDNSLQGRLAAITTPSSNRFFPTLAFRFQSYMAIGRADGQVVQDILAAVRQYNSGLGAGTGTTMG